MPRIAKDTNVPSSDIRQCLDPPPCQTDPFEYHMTQKNGHLSFPYNLATDNHYAQDSVGKDLLQCSLTVKQQGDQLFTVTLFDPSGVRKGQEEEYFVLSGQSDTVTGLPQDLKITRTGAFMASGGGMRFEYLSNPVFSWNGDTTGTSLQVASNGGYCTVTTSGTVQDLKCYFPCPAA
ncbi:MAG: hypothetical protein Q9179_003362 [Wetmoreana sp. 5 TL-2023]